MKILLTYSPQYTIKSAYMAKGLTRAGHTVETLIVNKDDANVSEIRWMYDTLDLIKWADEIDIIWDTMETGTVMIFAMAFALNKPVVLKSIDPKRMVNLFYQYSDEWKEKNAKEDGISFKRR